jgi:hypothetical protein
MVRLPNHPLSLHSGERRSPAGAERSEAGRAAALTAAWGRSSQAPPPSFQSVGAASGPSLEALDNLYEHRWGLSRTGERFGASYTSTTLAIMKSGWRR